MISLRFLAALLATTTSHLPNAAAAPVLTFPINSQVPPVARIAQQYTFTFSETTFVTTYGPITYSLRGQPEWLALDGAGRTLHGIPSANDEGSFTFHLTALDDSGQTTSSVTLIVVADGGPRIGQPLIPELTDTSSMTDTLSLYLPPLEDFAFSFSQSTFVDTTAATKFCAVSADSSPLPNWLQFDSRNLIFSGLSPTLVAPSSPAQTYGINLIASDIIGFAEATASFTLVVSYHFLAFSMPLLVFNLTAGQHFQSPSLLDQLRLDGKKVLAQDIVAVTSDAPSWLTLYTHDVSFSGLVPQNATPSLFDVTARDKVGNIATMAVKLQVDRKPELLSDAIPNLNATAGQAFNYSFSRSVLTNAAAAVVANVGNASNWLTFDPHNLSFTGYVPPQEPAGTSEITVTVSYQQIQQTEHFNITVFAPMRAKGPTLTPTPSYTMTSGGCSPTCFPTDGKPGLTKRKKLETILAVTIPCIFVAVMILLWLCILRQRKTEGPETQDSPSQEPIVSPEVQETGLAPITFPPATSVATTQRSRQDTPDRAPQIELSWAPDSLRTSRSRASKRMRAIEGLPTYSSWGDLAVPAQGVSQEHVVKAVDIGTSELPSVSPTSLPPSSEATPNHSRKRPTPQAQPTNTALWEGSRASRALSAQSNRSTVTRKVLSGVGHGKGGLDTFHVDDLQYSRQTRRGSMPLLDRLLNETIADQFPHPPQQTPENVTGNAVPAPQTVRLVRNENDTHHPAAYAKGQAGHIQRARARLEGLERSSSLWPSVRESNSGLPFDGLVSHAGTTPTIDELGTAGVRELSWSQWSPVAPAAQRSVTFPQVLRERSDVSSGQFSSALSSDSGWEDENLEEGIERSLGMWRNPTRPESERPQSPCPPFEAQKGLKTGTGNTTSAMRLGPADKHRSVSMDKGNVHRPPRSQQGSLRFL